MRNNKISFLFWNDQLAIFFSALFLFAKSAKAFQACHLSSLYSFFLPSSVSLIYPLSRSPVQVRPTLPISFSLLTPLLSPLSPVQVRPTHLASYISLFPHLLNIQLQMCMQELYTLSITRFQQRFHELRSNFLWQYTVTHIRKKHVKEYA